MLDASRLLSVASARGGIEQLMNALLSEAYAAKNIIVCFDNAELFFEEGVGSVDLTSLLLPIIEAGSIRMIMTIDEQRFLQMTKRTPALAAAMNKIMVHPTDEYDSLKVLEDHLPLVEHKRKVTYMYQALKESYKLSQRYVYDLAMPGQAVRLMEQAADYADDGLVTARSVNLAIEKTTGVKTAAADDTSEKETLLNLESLIHERMIGQERAVQVVSDALRRARSGVRNQNRPVGTFLFLGPTGVGKTELAKSLASVYFGGEDNIIRLDMNEFVSSDDVSRLIADGADDAGSLTAQVMKRPFSVVLLDEIEKAHSSVLTTLLQLLDEGIMRDVRGREVSFRDTVVIATSNAGAERIREYITRGYELSQFEEQFVNELISSHIFHPEFLNRFDEMVVFGPLSKEQLLKVVDLILVGINKNLAEQKITVTVAADAKQYLVEAGYDPRLGARPMRRVVQRAVENTVAKLLLSGEVTPGSTIEITRDQVASIVSARTEATAIIEENK
jgi:ATP-dependent Clp protease ATP-binding subunit ClpC